MFNVQGWELTSVWALISLALQDCWETTGDSWDTTDRIVISYINQMPSYTRVSLMDLWKWQMLWWILANDISSPTCITGMSAKQAGRNTSWILLVLNGFSSELTDQSVCHLTVTIQSLYIYIQYTYTQYSTLYIYSIQYT